jgi:hypothetical protein
VGRAFYRGSTGGNVAEIADDATMEMLRQQMGIQPANANRITVRFSILAEQDMDASEKAGKPVFRDVDFITKWIPGDKDNVVHRPVRITDQAEFPDQFKAFKNNKEQPQTGTPLSMLPFMSPAQVAELNYYGVRTAEQVITMSDANGQRVMGFQGLKQKTQQYLDAVAGAAPAQALQSELNKRDEEIALLKAVVDELGKKVEESASRRK